MFLGEIFLSHLEKFFFSCGAICLPISYCFGKFLKNCCQFNAKSFVEMITNNIKKLEKKTKKQQY
jgi:hypothetical protein